MAHERRENAPKDSVQLQFQRVASKPCTSGNATAEEHSHDIFRRFAHRTSISVGSPWAFIAAVAIIVVWAITGPLFRYSDTWQLIINTGTTIVTFLMVFLIQNTQNRDATALHLKLDELIRAMKGARTGLVDLEDLSDEELDRLHQEFRRLGRRPPRGEEDQGRENP